MKAINDARASVLGAVPRMPVVVVDVDDALHRVTMVPAMATGSVPPFDNSAMDGFAVRSSDVAEVPVQLEVIEDVPAGTVPTKVVGPGQAIRIMTGAPMPDGADAVVMVEDTSTVSDTSVSVGVSVPPGMSVRARGGDVAPGDQIVDAGVRLTARHVAALASSGISPSVARPPSVAVMSTGDEVVAAATATLEPGMIRDTNRPMLLSLLSDLRIPTNDLGIIGDDIDELRTAYEEAAASSDLVISTGGVSMGDYDFVKTVLGESGTVEFWRVAMQPAKPFAFGSFNGVPLLGLPGNPVSTFVAFEQFVRPALLHMMGATAVMRPRIDGVMGEDVSTNPDKEVFIRVMLARDTSGFVALKSGGQGSNIVSALADADALAVVPVGVGDLSAGDPVTLEMFTWDESRDRNG